LKLIKIYKKIKFVSELWRGGHLYIYVTITSKLAAVLTDGLGKNDDHLPWMRN